MHKQQFSYELSRLQNTSSVCSNLVWSKTPHKPPATFFNFQWPVCFAIVSQAIYLYMYIRTSTLLHAH